MAEEYKPGQLPYPEQDERSKFCKFHYKGVCIILIPLIFSPILLLVGETFTVLQSRMLFLTICIYLYYVINVMAQGATAFLFIVFLPICGITASKVICMAHYSDLIFTTYGAIFMGSMMDNSKLSERLAMVMIKICGTNLRVLQVVTMLFTAFTSIIFNGTFMSAFWMKVTQAVIVEYAAAGVLVANSEEEPYERESKPYPSRPVVGIFLTVGFAATLGGMVSPFQDPNGLIYAHFVSFTNATGCSFVILYICPFILGLIVVAVWINIIFLGLVGGSVKEEVRAASEGKDAIKQAMTDKSAGMGPWTIHSKLAIVMIIFTLLLLFTRRPLFFQGWDNQISGSKDGPSLCGASVAVILIVIIVFAVPANYIFCRYYVCREPEKPGSAPSLVGWKYVNLNTPWAHIFMLAAGYGFTSGLVDSQLDVALLYYLSKLKLPDSLTATLLGTFYTTLAPASAVGRRTLDTFVSDALHSYSLKYASSLHNQFLLPVSTPANTIVAGWGNVRPFQFLLGGIVPAIFMFIFLILFVDLLGKAAFPMRGLSS